MKVGGLSDEVQPSAQAAGQFERCCATILWSRWPPLSSALGRVNTAMRSVSVHFCNAGRAEVAGLLSRLYKGPAPSDERGNWVCEQHGDGDPVLYIDIYQNEDLRSECGDEAYEAIVSSFRGHPTTSVWVNVSGRHDGTPEVLTCVTSLLRALSGVALDGYTDHAWTLDELQAGARVKEHPFFDYGGW